jgi:hypothetical protein
MVGEPVDVHLMSTDPAVAIVNFYGTQDSRSDVRHRSRCSDDEAFEFVVVRGGAEVTFYIERTFSGGAYVAVARRRGGALEVCVAQRSCRSTGAPTGRRGLARAPCGAACDRSFCANPTRHRVDRRARRADRCRSGTTT